MLKVIVRQELRVGVLFFVWLFIFIQYWNIDKKDIANTFKLTKKFV